MANENKEVENKSYKKDAYIEDIVSKATKQAKELSQDEIANAVESTEFLKRMEEIDMPDDSYKIIFTDGQVQLLYDNGEYFEISTTDSSAQKKKLGKKEARDKYIEYFMKYVLNPMINKMQRQRGIRTVERVITPKVKTKQKEGKTKEDRIR